MAVSGRQGLLLNSFRRDLSPQDALQISAMSQAAIKTGLGAAATVASIATPGPEDVLVAAGVFRGLKALEASNVTKSAGNAGKVKLNKQLASQEQIGEINSGVAERIAGAGTSKDLRDAPRLANEYGGYANDWAKVRSSNRTHSDGFNQETHAYQNTTTGQVVEHKTKISGH